MYFGATRSFLKRHGVYDLAEVAEIHYRDGAWPGSVRCLLNSGRSFSSPKFQFNHLISFYAVERCLLCADLAAEGADISVADAWDKRPEAGAGSSLVISRTTRGESIVADLARRGVIKAEDISLEQALAMHAHGIDLKKTGALLRIQRLAQRGRPSPQYDLPGPNPPLGRQLAEVFISGQFRLLRTRPARWIVDHIPFGLIGSVYVWRTKSGDLLRRKNINPKAMVQRQSADLGRAGGGCSALSSCWSCSGALDPKNAGRSCMEPIHFGSLPPARFPFRHLP